MISKPGRLILFGLAISVAAIMLTGSCVKRSAPVKPEETAKAETKEEKKAEGELIKPSLAQEIQKSEDRKPETAKPVQDVGAKESKPARGPTKNPPKNRSSKNDEPTEEPRIMAAMKELAQSVGGVTLAKLCYVKDDDEYWILLYRESNGKVDLKQFIWNRHSEIPEPFLVIREFSRGRMNIEMKKNEEGKECKVIKLDEEKQKSGDVKQPGDGT